MPAESPAAPRGTVCCVGVGNVGRAWAIAFARAGHRVTLFDRSAEALNTALTMIDGTLADLASAGCIRDASELRGRIVRAPTLAEALHGAIHVQESVTENVEVKRALFAELDRLAPQDAVLTSSTSEISASRLFSDLPGRSRCLVAHPLNPPSLIPLVELCPTPATSPSALERARAFYLGTGHKPIVVRKEITGFIANRLQLAVLGEALHLVGEGYCDAQDIDVAMRDGLALRWAVVGPFETGHLNSSRGYRDYLKTYGETHRNIIKALNVSYDWGQALIDRIHAQLSATTPEADVPTRQAWRDRRLMALSAHLAEDAEKLGR